MHRTVHRLFHNTCACTCTLQDEIKQTTRFSQSMYTDSIHCLCVYDQSFVPTAADDYIQHYTGLPNHTYKVLTTVFDFVFPKEEQHTKLQEFVITLIKLCLNLSSQDLAYHFDVHSSTISRI